YGNLALDLDFKYSYIRQNTGWPGNMVELTTVPNSGTNNIPAHTFANAYYEITYRVQPIPGSWSGGTQTFWQFTCCGTGFPFVDNEIFEDWSTWGNNLDYGYNIWDVNANITATGVKRIQAHDATQYHTFGVLFTSNTTGFSQCSYFDGT